MSARNSLALAVLVLLVAAVLRMVDLTTLPPGLSDEEITDIRLMETIRRGDIRVFYSIGGEGREGLYHTVLAAGKSLFGGGTIMFRMASFWTGMLTLALTYALVKRLFGPLAAVLALALLAFGMWPVLLARRVGRESFVALLVVAVLLALVIALQVHRRQARREGSTSAFAALGALLGFGFYLHPVSLMVALMTMTFIAFNVFMRRPMTQRGRTYTSFAILLTIIIAMPYVISSVRTPELAAASRLFGDFHGLLRSLGDGLAGFVFVGDRNPPHNLPGRPLIDLVSGLLVAVGLVTVLRHWRQPRFALPLIAVVALAPPALVTEDSPNFLSYAALMPLLALLFGLGASVMLRSVTGSRRNMLGVGLAVLAAFNLFSTARDLYDQWPRLRAVQEAAHSRIGGLAHHLDLTAASIPSVVCAKGLNEPARSAELSGAEEIALLLNRQDSSIRYVDCQKGLVFTNGGARQQVILPETDTIEGAHPYLRDWLQSGEMSTDPNVPPESVLLLEATNALADTAGRFTTTALLSYPPEAEEPGEQPIFGPPVSFGGNLTFLGYEKEEPGNYKPGAILTLITYWRVDGPLPPDAILFTHLLADPAAIPAAQTDTISVNPRQLQARDVFVQITYVILSYSTPKGIYMISIGAYQNRDKVRLVVLENGTPRANRLFLYPITVSD